MTETAPNEDPVQKEITEILQPLRQEIQKKGPTLPKSIVKSPEPLEKFMTETKIGRKTSKRRREPPYLALAVGCTVVIGAGVVIYNYQPPVKKAKVSVVSAATTTHPPTPQELKTNEEANIDMSDLFAGTPSSIAFQPSSQSAMAPDPHDLFD